MKSAFEYKPELRLSEFVIEKTVRISDESFARMLCHSMDGQPFIAENIDLMYQDDDDVYPCILVTGENRMGDTGGKRGIWLCPIRILYT